VTLELSHFIGIKIFKSETATSEMKPVEVGGVELFKSTDQGLHVEFGVGLVVSEVGEADFDFVAKLGGLFFGFGDASLVALGELDWGGSGACASSGWAK